MCFDCTSLQGYTKELKARVVAYHFFTEPAPSWKDTAQRFNVPYQTVRKWCRTKSPWQAVRAMLYLPCVPILS